MAECLNSQPVDNLLIVSKPQPERLTLSDVTRCDPEVTAFIASVRARFPGARPLWGKSSAGEIGRQP